VNAGDESIMGMVEIEKKLPLGLGAPKEVDEDQEVSFV
jgi:hypothetical protein